MQTCVTSPPYWGLRDYGTAIWEGGDAGCDHKGAPLASSKKSTLAGYTSENVKVRTFTVPYRDLCGKCGARRIDAQLGLEPTPEAYVAALVEVFREVKRVLRDDGTLWLNLGDSYAGVGAQTGGTRSKEHGRRADRMFKPGIMWASTGLKPKNLVGIPWRVAFALQADGWYLRADIIWAKQNCMPESVQDRPTRSHEYLFLMSKSERYHYDTDAISEPIAEVTARDRVDTGRFRPERGFPGPENAGNGRLGSSARRNKRSVWTVATAPFSDWGETVRLDRVPACAAPGDSLRIGSPDCPDHAGLPDRATTAFGDERVAGELSRMLDISVDRVQGLLASPVPTGLHRARCSARGSWDWPRPACAASATGHSNGSRRTARAPETSPACTPSAQTPVRTDDRQGGLGLGDSVGRKPASSSVEDSASGVPAIADAETACDICGRCRCSYVVIIRQQTSHFATFPPDLIKPCILAGSRVGDAVLDPFAGAGTTLYVAKELGRKGLGIELNPAYIALAEKRMRQEVLAL